MNLLAPYQPNTPEPLNISVSSYSNQTLTQASVSRQQNKDITIFTEDGDKVTLSSAQQSRAFYARFNSVSHESLSGSHDNYAINQYNAMAYQEERFGYENSQNLSMSVDGNLDKQELKDIRKAIKVIDRIMTRILNGGDINKGLARALRLVNGESISGIAADYSYANTLAVEHTAIEEIATYSKEGQAETARPVADKHFGPMHTLIDEMANLVKDSDIKPSKMIQPIKQLFSSLIEALSDDEHPDNAKMHLAHRIEEGMLEKIKHMHKRSKRSMHPCIDKMV